MAERISLPHVSDRTQSGDKKRWHVEPLTNLISAKLEASWNDQGWGNRKGGMFARTIAADGKQLHGWRKLAGPAQHYSEAIELTLPEEFFSGEAPNPELCLYCSEHGNAGGDQIRIPGDPARYIALATYGVHEKSNDVTDIVKRELAAGKQVKASPWDEAIAIFGDPCHGIRKSLVVALTEDAMERISEEDRAGLCLSCDEDGGSISIPGNDPTLIASAKYGFMEADKIVNVTDIVVRELAAGKPVRARNGEGNRLFGDPYPGVPKAVVVTLTEDATFEPTIPMPDDAKLELGYVVGGGGGHSIQIDNAYLHPKRVTKVLTATLSPPEWVITTMAGEEFARLVAAEGDTEESLTERIQGVALAKLEPGVGFRIVMADRD